VFLRRSPKIVIEKMEQKIVSNKLFSTNSTVIHWVDLKPYP
jgi:hypothetical protein